MAAELGAWVSLGVWGYRLARCVWGIGGRMLGWVRRKLLPRVERAVRIDRTARDAVVVHDQLIFDVAYDNYLGAVDFGAADVWAWCAHGDAQGVIRVAPFSEEAGTFRVRLLVGPKLWHELRRNVPLNAHVPARARLDFHDVQPWGLPHSVELDLTIWRRDMGSDDPKGSAVAAT